MCANSKMLGRFPSPRRHCGGAVGGRHFACRIYRLTARRRVLLSLPRRTRSPRSYSKPTSIFILPPIGSPKLAITARMRPNTIALVEGRRISNQNCIYSSALVPRVELVEWDARRGLTVLRIAGRSCRSRRRPRASPSALGSHSVVRLARALPQHVDANVRHRW
jgi:hypothetical protein